MVELCSHLATERAGVVTLPLPVRAPLLYPTTAYRWLVHKKVTMKEILVPLLPLEQFRLGPSIRTMNGSLK